ncbi:MAG: electron transfer flavoprotein subunit alpha/FixB family protein [Deltaproteobacteria bacterium]|nr:electron transfer flavoprotein subunit alpha/FixB family protein [Deltaproteobacteria bacterium]
MGNVLVIAQILDGEVKKSTNCTVTFASQVASSLGGTYSVLALGADLSAQTDTLTKLGADKVLLAEAPDLDQNLAERWMPIIEQVIKAGGYQVVVSPSSSTGKDVLPRLSCRLGAGMASDVVGVAFEDGKLTYQRPMFAGNVNGAVQIASDLEIVTIRQTEFAPFEPTGASPVEKVDVGGPEEVLGKIEWGGFEKSVSERPDLAEANVVVSGGRGLKAKENFKLIEDLADLLGGAVGATRAAVDAGFIHNDFQVGQTGKIVAPDLYFAVGLSGALQHVAGMKSSKVIVGINKDEEAPIFQVSDYGMVADLFKVMPDLTDQIKKATT